MTHAGYFIPLKNDSYPYTSFEKSQLSAPSIGQNNPLNCPQKSVVNNTLKVDSLPPLHKDPFDRLLLAQARTEGMLLLTGDASVAQYRESVLAV
jgi:hypothetical protein